MQIAQLFLTTRISRHLRLVLGTTTTFKTCALPNIVSVLFRFPFEDPVTQLIFGKSNKTRKIARTKGSQVVAAKNANNRNNMVVNSAGGR